MDLAERVCNILMNAHALSICFWFNDINGNRVLVQGPQFIMVAQRIRDMHVAVVESADVPPEKAIYTARNDGVRRGNTLYFGANDFASIGFRALVVHEAVHVAFDLQRTTIPWVDNEAAGWIAQGFYINNLGVPDGNVNAGDFIYLGKMIAQDFSQRREIDDFWMDALREKLRNDPDYAVYINQTFIGDG